MIESRDTQPDIPAALTGVKNMTDIQTTIQTAAKKKAPAKKTSAKSAKKSTKRPVAVLKKEGSTKGPGVIATIVETISREKGATSEECLAVLVKAFPDRDPDGMVKTIRIQAAKNATSKDRDEKRGLVYFKRR
jgi:hypothetical protein